MRASWRSSGSISPRSFSRYFSSLANEIIWSPFLRAIALYVLLLTMVSDRNDLRWVELLLKFFDKAIAVSQLQRQDLNMLGHDLSSRAQFLHFRCFSAPSF